LENCAALYFDYERISYEISSRLVHKVKTATQYFTRVGISGICISALPRTVKLAFAIKRIIAKEASKTYQERMQYEYFF